MHAEISSSRGGRVMSFATKERRMLVDTFLLNLILLRDPRTSSTSFVVHFLLTTIFMLLMLLKDDTVPSVAQFRSAAATNVCIVFSFSQPTFWIKFLYVLIFLRVKH